MLGLKGGIMSPETLRTTAIYLRRTSVGFVFQIVLFLRKRVVSNVTKQTLRLSGFEY